MKTTRLFATACALALATGAASAETVRFWYHFDNPENPMQGLVDKFEMANPDIAIEAENIPWNSYYDQLYTALIGGSAPDAAMVKLFAQPRLIEMGALEPIGDLIDAWPGKAELLDTLLELNAGPDGEQYYLPIQYVVLYLYYRPDLFEAAGVKPPETCEEFRAAAKALTGGDTYGFGFRGGKGGWDQWGAFTLSTGAELAPGKLVTPGSIAGTQMLVDMFETEKSIPPSAPNDGFQEIIGAFKSGKTAMTIHHMARPTTSWRRSATRSRPCRCRPATGTAGPLTVTSRWRSCRTPRTRTRPGNGSRSWLNPRTTSSS